MSHHGSKRAGARPAVWPCSHACSGCDWLVGLEGVHVEQVQRVDSVFVVTVSTTPHPMGRPTCGVVAAVVAASRRVLHDMPGAIQVRVIRRYRLWRCADPDCARACFSSRSQHSWKRERPLPGARSAERSGRSAGSTRRLRGPSGNWAPPERRCGGRMNPSWRGVQPINPAGFGLMEEMPKTAMSCRKVLGTA